MKKAIVIDVNKKEVYETELDEGLQPIYNALECETFDCPFALPNSDTLYVDDEGLLKESRVGFHLKGAPQDYVGNGLLLGTNYETGESVDVKTSLEWVKENVIFIDEVDAPEPSFSFVSW